MSQKNFTKEDFTKIKDGEYQLEYTISEIGEGADLIVERMTENGNYEMIQPQLRKSNDKISIIWDSPFDGRILFDV
ncbi:glutathione synthase [Chryseobacterium cucumeris]|uniref:Glutathione synthase n=1 Tax=Chryseobacterium indologenes TaxID=253 RepID=A0A411DKS7_CHRID|nr:glutathione synthase [Chryseobacterium indologenes]